MKRWFCLVLVSVLILLNSIVAYASSVTSVVDIPSNYSATISSLCIEANKSVDTNILNLRMVSVSGSIKYTLEFVDVEYSKLSYTEKEKFMETTLGFINRSSMGNNVKSRVYNFIAKQDTAVTSALKYLQSDVNTSFEEARLWFEPFSSPVSSFLGFGCIIIALFLALSILFDVFYLNIPGIQVLLERGEPTKKPFGVSVEAWSTYKDVLSGNKFDENIMSVFIKKRMPSMIGVSLCVAYLISGKVYDVIIYFVDYFIRL